MKALSSSRVVLLRAASLFIVAASFQTGSAAPMATPIPAANPPSAPSLPPVPENSTPQPPKGNPMLLPPPVIAPPKNPTPSLTPQPATAGGGVPLDPLNPIPAPAAPVTTGPQSFSVIAPKGHFPDWLQAEFTAKLGVPLKVQFVGNPEEEQADLTAPNAHYDLALVTDRIIPPLIAANALRGLPSLPDLGIDHRFLGHGFIDRDNHYCLPYGWGLLAIAYRIPNVKSAPLHWADMDEPSLASQLMVADVPSLKVLDDKGRAWAIVKHLPLPNTDPLGAAFNSAPSAAANYWVAPYGLMRTALLNQPGWKFSLPEEGSIIFLYHAVIPASAERPDLAERAIPLLFDPAVTSKLDAENFIATTQAAAQALIPPDQTHDLIINPPNTVISRCVFSHR